jgi:hypothetical protein
MLPVVTADIRDEVEHIFAESSEDWKRDMIHHLKEDNPEVNSLLLNFAQASSDPKKVIMAGYLVYKALERASENEMI